MACERVSDLALPEDRKLSTHSTYAHGCTHLSLVGVVVEQMQGSEVSVVLGGIESLCALLVVS